MVRLGILGVAAFWSARAAGAAPAHDPETPSAGMTVRAETITLLKADSKLVAVAQAQAAAATAHAPVNAPGTVVMSPYVLRESKTPDVRVPRYESPVLRILSDGTLCDKVGKKFSTRILLHFYTTGASDGVPGPGPINVPPKNGIQLAISWAW